MKEFDVLVIGGGISGLLTAYQLGKAGQNVQVLEAQNRCGGWIDSFSLQGQIFENGPNSILADEAWIDLLKCLKLEWIEKPAELKKRFVLKNGKLVPVPLSPLSFLCSYIVSAQAKLSLLREWIKPQAFQASSDPSIQDFFNARFHSDISNYLVDPFIGGVFAGDISKLSMKSVFPELYDQFLISGSLVKAGIKRRPTSRKPILSFRKGMCSLVEALEAALRGRIQLGLRVDQISDSQEGGFLVRAGAQDFQAKQIVVGVSSKEAARLLQPYLKDQHLRFLSGIFYQPIQLWHCLWKKPQDFDSGFGCLIPSIEGQGAFRGSLWPSEIFPQRYSSDYLATTQYYSGDKVSSPELAQVQKFLGLSEKPLEEKWISLGPAIPQFMKGHRDAVQALRQALPNRLHLVGNYLDGVGLSAVLKTSSGVSHRILAPSKDSDSLTE